MLTPDHSKKTRRIPTLNRAFRIMRWEFLHSNFKWVIIGILWWPLVFLGCEKGTDTTQQNEVLIQVGSSVVTVDGFHKAFDRTVSNYSAALFHDTHALQNVKYRLLNQLTEELIILERAKELQLNITPVELKNAVDEFKKDFPEDQFEKTLFESGIGFADWQASLEKRLLMEEVVTKELKEMTPLPQKQIHLSQKETGGNDSIERKKTPAPPDPGKDPLKKAIDEQTEAAYENWMNELKKKYAIKINWSLWEAIYE